MVFLGDWAQRTVDARRLLHGESRHVLIIAKKQCVTRNSYMLRNWRDVPQGLGKEQLQGLLFLP